MKEIIIVGCNDINNLFNMLDDLMAIIGLYFEKELIDNNKLKIIFDNDEEDVEKYILINIDEKLKENLSMFEGYKVITIGFNNKASLTISSVQDEEEIVFCVQREINMRDAVIEPQEFKVTGNFFVRSNMLNNMFAFTAILLIVENSISNLKKYF